MLLCQTSGVCFYVTMLLSKMVFRGGDQSAMTEPIFYTYICYMYTNLSALHLYLQSSKLLCVVLAKLAREFAETDGRVLVAGAAAAADRPIG